MEINTEINPALTPEIDSNAEYISAKGVHDQPPIITSVFKSIFIETPKDFFISIRNFFRRFADLFTDGFKYLKYPSLKIDPFATKDYKENCQHTFEYILLVIAFLVFLIKLDWIFGEELNKQTYNNDISNTFMQFFIFLIFAISYFVMVLFSVLIGRLFRMIFKIHVTRHEVDILFTYLNNIIFIVMASLAFFLRCIVPYRNIEGQEQMAAWSIIIVYGLIFGIMIFKWAGRLALLNNMRSSIKPVFQVVITLATAIYFSFCGLILTSVIWGL